MKIGVFGGSFDPVHSEHVRMAASAIDCLGLDELFVVPAAAPPHKPWKRMTDDGVRLRALEIAFADVPKTTVSRYEIDKKGTSYTYLTCRYFKERYPTADLYFLVGTDMLRDFPTWRNPQDILENATLAVCGRAEEEGWQTREQADFEKLFHRRFVTISYEGKKISSTAIRVLLAAGESTQGMLPDKVEAYLRTCDDYVVPFAKEALALQAEKRKTHSLRVAMLAAERAPSLGLDERRAITAALFHDCAKNLGQDSPLLRGFSMKEGVPAPVLHQYTGAYVAKTAFGITDEDVLDAICYHTSGKPNMTTLGKLIYLADALEAGRTYDGVEKLRAQFWQKDGLDKCLLLTLKGTLEHLRKGEEEPYGLTEAAYKYYQEIME